MAPAASTQPRAGKPARLALAGLALGLLCACAGGSGRSGEGPAADPQATGRYQSAEYRRYSEQMVGLGRFRTERAPADAPVSAAQLARNFELVAFEPEAALARYYPGDAQVRRVSKWTRPVRYVFIGDGVRESDRAAFRAFAARLSRLTGLPFEETDDIGSANMQIFVLSAESRAALLDRSQANPAFQGSVAEAWVNGLNPPCFALFQTRAAEGGEISDAAIFIKDELDEPLRTACFVEETTQSLGLMFDHDEVRPSIFNDDQEFIALTRHDEALLAILYDDRLYPGMPRSDAVVAARAVIRDRADALGVD